MRHHDGRSCRTPGDDERRATTPPGAMARSAGRSRASRPPPRGRSPPSIASAAALTSREFVERPAQAHVAGLARGQPLPEPFELEQPPVRGHLPAHPEQGVLERADPGLPERGHRVEHAVVEARRGPQHLDRLASTRPAACSPTQTRSPTVPACARPSATARSTSSSLAPVSPCLPRSLSNGSSVTRVEVHPLLPQEVQAAGSGPASSRGCPRPGSCRRGRRASGCGRRGARPAWRGSRGRCRACRASASVPRCASARARGRAGVPGDVDVPGQQLLDLPLVVGEQREVEVDAGVAEVVADALPDGDHLGVVGDGAQEDRVSHRSS